MTGTGRAAAALLAIGLALSCRPPAVPTSPPPPPFSATTGLSDPHAPYNYIGRNGMVVA